jgi:formyltetrahydrofolate synthetase
MEILAVARDLFDLRKRLGAITVVYTWEGEPVTAEQLRAAGAMTVLLKDAIRPNLVQTLEGQPAFVHCGPFANIAHGNNSLVADLVALKLADYVVTESGFGSDMGMEKFLDIVCRIGEIQPNAICLVTTVRALKHHGDDPDGGVEAVERGAANLQRHLGIVSEFGLKAVVAINRFPGDPDEEVEAVRRLALEGGAHAAELNEAFERGGEGAAALAEALVDAADQPSSYAPIYPLEAPIAEKIEAVCKRVYGADGVAFLPAAQQKIEQFTANGFDKLPICMAKTHLSLSHDPSLLNAPTGFTVTVRDIRAYTGSGWLVPLLGDMQTMPGLGVTPAAVNVDIDENGRTVGLF